MIVKLIFLLLGSVIFAQAALADSASEATVLTKEAVADVKAFDPAARPYIVQLPDGWEVSELKAPRPYSGREIGGGRLRAIKKESEGAAVIELTYMSKPVSGEQPDLSYEFGHFVTTIKSEYESKGLKATVTETKKSNLSVLPAEEAEVVVSGAGSAQDLHQWFAMAMGKNYVYALSFTGHKDYYDKFLPAFEKCRQSLKVE